MDIVFLHPGYEKPGNRLLALPRVDVCDKDFGVDYRTALLACQIIANNAFEGYLALDRQGTQQVTEPPSGVLLHKTYYFILKDGIRNSDPVTCKYPVVPSFKDWEFPHDNLPSYWPKVQYSPEMQITGSRCSITNFLCYTETPHLVPREEAEWYKSNDMKRYTSAVVSSINNPENTFTLRPDFHRYFDKRYIVIVPKTHRGEERPSGPVIKYATHIINCQAAELWPKYHNTMVQYLHKSSRPFLFARFAWAILLGVKNFLLDGEPRNIVQIKVKDNNRAVWEVVSMQGSDLTKAYGGGGSISATPAIPRKRKLVVGTDAEEYDVLSDSSDSSDNESNPSLLREWGREEKRKQISSDETAPDPEMLSEILEKVATEEAQGVEKDIASWWAS